MTAAAMLLCLLQVPTNPIRAQETAVMMARTGIPTIHEPPSAAPHPYVMQVQARRFEDKFNKLVKAVEEFSLAYNSAKGQVWPADKAAALKKAMEDLQKADPSLAARK
jgi:hypothetical protein